MIDLGKIFKRKESSSLGKQLMLDYNQHRPLGPQKYLCYAPFKNIYFGHGGKAVACCYNRNYILGEYPEMTVKEIWQGKQANQLREYIKNNDLSLGCYSCKQQIVVGNHDGVKAKQYDERKLNGNGYPSVMEFELSNVCNLECVMCSGNFSSLIRANREKLPPIVSSYDDAFVEQLEEFIPHLEEAIFYGGEPFLIEIYYLIWEKIIKINPQVRISVQTNATVLNNRVKEILLQTNFHINISLDSLNKDSYEKIRKNANYDKVRENIDYFHRYTKSKNTFFGISVCAMQQNWRELPEFIDFCNKLDAPVYFHTVFNPISNSIRGMTSDELSQVEKYLLQFDFPTGTDIQKKNRTHYFDFVKQVSAWHEESKKATSKNSINDFVDLRDQLTEHIKEDPMLTQKDKDKKIARILKKITDLENKLDPDLTERIFTSVTQRDSLIPSIVFYLDTLPVSALALMAKSFVK